LAFLVANPPLPMPFATGIFEHKTGLFSISFYGEKSFSFDLAATFSFSSW
jgi:hypothetical protein